MIYFFLVTVAVMGAVATTIRVRDYNLLRASILVPVACLVVSGLFAMWVKLTGSREEWSGLLVGASIGIGLSTAMTSFVSGILAGWLRLRYLRRP